MIRKRSTTTVWALFATGSRKRLTILIWRTPSTIVLEDEGDGWREGVGGISRIVIGRIRSSSAAVRTTAVDGSPDDGAGRRPSSARSSGLITREDRPINQKPTRPGRRGRRAGVSRLRQTCVPRVSVKRTSVARTQRDDFHWARVGYRARLVSAGDRPDAGNGRAREPQEGQDPIRVFPAARIILVGLPSKKMLC